MPNFESTIPSVDLVWNPNAAPSSKSASWRAMYRTLDLAQIRQTATAAIGPALFPVLWIFIGLVSSYDAYLTLKFEHSIVAMELNPIGQWLLALDDGEPTLFIAAKFFGTILVLGLLNLFRRYLPRLGWHLTGIVALFQFGLLLFLSS